MTADWYMAYGSVELVNHARLGVYLDTVGSPLTSYSGCGCPTFTPAVVGDLPYTTPEEDGAPWYDPDAPESADFAGLMVLNVDGLDDRPVKRAVTGGIAGGGSIGPARTVPRTITVTALVLARTCCGAEYGLQWLGEALEGCTAGGCDGDCLTVYSCCPGKEDLTPDEFNERYRRTLRRVALVDGPNVVARSGNGCGSGGDCQSGADVITVEFVLTAATPWLWTEPTPVMEITPPLDASDECVTWCIHPPGGEGCTDGECRFAPCTDPTAACADTRCLPPAPPTPTGPDDTCFCLPLAVERDCYDLDLTDRPTWSVDVPIITVTAGDTDLRNVTIELFERSPNDAGLSCEEIADQYRCEPHSVYAIQYVPAGGALTLDGQVGRATVECGGVCESSADVYGRDGLPPTWKPLACASFCLCVSTDVSNPPSPDALITVNVSGRGR